MSYKDFTKDELRAYNNKATKRWYQRNKEEILEKVRKRRLNPKFLEKQRKYRRNRYRKLKGEFKIKNIKWREQNKQKKRCQTLLNSAIKSGKITNVPTKCEKCQSSERLVKHHPDYSKPFLFKVLCRRCHSEEHGQTGRALLKSRAGGEEPPRYPQPDKGNQNNSPQTKPENPMKEIADGSKNRLRQSKDIRDKPVDCRKAHEKGCQCRDKQDKIPYVNGGGHWCLKCGEDIISCKAKTKSK